MALLVITFAALAAPIPFYVMGRQSVRIAYIWAWATLIVGLSWGLLLALGHSSPIIQLSAQETVAASSWGFYQRFGLLADATAWPFGLAILALLLTNQLTLLSRMNELTWRNQAGGQVLMGLGLLAVFAATPVMLILLWSIFDVLDLTAKVLGDHSEQVRQEGVRQFAWRLVGSFLLALAVAVGAANGTPLNFDMMSGSAVPLVLLAVGFRLGVLPLQVSAAQERTPTGLETALTLVPMASSLVLLVRTAGPAWTSGWANLALILVAIAAVFGSLNWWFAPDEQRGRRYWILALAALAFASAILGTPMAATAWGLVLLLAGGLLFNFSHQVNRSILVVALGLLGLSMLPLTPSEPGLLLLLEPSWPLALIFLLSLTMLFAGYLKHGVRLDRTSSSSVLGARVLMALGLLLLPITHFLTIWRQPELLQLDISSTWLALFPAAAVAGLEYGRRRWLGPNSLVAQQPLFERWFSFQWLYRWLWRGYRILQFGIGFLSGLLEGNGGFLWVMLLLALVLSLFFGGA